MYGGGDDDDDGKHLIWRGSDIAISHGHPGHNKLCIKTVVALDIASQFFFSRNIRCSILHHYTILYYTSYNIPMGIVLGSFGAFQGNIWSVAPFIPVGPGENR